MNLYGLVPVNHEDYCRHKTRRYSLGEQTQYLNEGKSMLINFVIFSVSRDSPFFLVDTFLIFAENFPG